MAFNLALHVVGELASAEFGKIYPVRRTQAADLTLVVRPLRGEVAALVYKAVPDVDIGDAGLFRPTAVDLVELRGISACLGVALRGQTNPDHGDACALER